MRSSSYAYVLGALFAAEASFPIIHRLTGAQYNGFTAGHTLVVDPGLAALWLCCAAVAIARRPLNGLTLLLAGASASAIHGLLFTIATTARGPSLVGLPFLVLSGIEFFCVAHAVAAFRAAARAPAAVRALRPRGPTTLHAGGRVPALARSTRAPSRR